MFTDRDAAVSSAAIEQVVQAVRAHRRLRPYRATEKARTAADKV
jgi:hypothetical protein